MAFSLMMIATGTSLFSSCMILFTHAYTYTYRTTILLVNLMEWNDTTITGTNRAADWKISTG